MTVSSRQPIYHHCVQDELAVFEIIRGGSFEENRTDAVKNRLDVFEQGRDFPFPLDGMNQALYGLCPALGGRASALYEHNPVDQAAEAY